MKFLKQNLGWFAAASLCLCSLFIYCCLAGCRFLSYVVMGAAAVAAVYQLLFMLRKKRRTFAQILLWSLTGLIGIGLAVSTWAGVLIGTAAAGDPDTPCDYVIVLGAGVNGTTPSLSLQERINTAADYLQTHPETQCIVSGGQGPNEDISEAQCMFDAWTAKGISPDRIWMEDKSTSTRENLAFSLKLIEEKTGTRPETAGILSSEYHMYRAGRFAMEQGLTPVGIPAKTSWITLFISYFVREIFAVCYYTVFG